MTETETAPVCPTVDTCVYVYAVVADDHPATVRADSGAYLVGRGPVRAVCSAIDSALLTTLADAESEETLVRLARRHDVVVRQLAEAGATLPVRLGTLCADAERLERALTHASDELTAQLTAVRGCGEWSVRVLAEPGPDASARADVTGTDYLLGRRRAKERRARQRRNAADAIRELHEALSVYARRNAASSSLTGERLFSGVYLVPQAYSGDVEERCAAAAARLAKCGARLVVTGPLPPYSFADVQLEVRA